MLMVNQMNKIHNYFKKKLFNRYDFINGILLGIGAATGAIWPLIVVCILLILTFI